MDVMPPSIKHPGAMPKIIGDACRRQTREAPEPTC